MRVAIITASTLGYKGEREDKSGPYIKKVVENAGFEVKVMKVLPDDRRILGEVMKRLADSNIVDLIITTGGTGFSESDVTPEATLDIVERLEYRRQCVPTVCSLQNGQCCQGPRLESANRH